MSEEKVEKQEPVEAESAAETADAPKMSRPLILGRKLGMLQHFKEDGSVMGATVIAVENNLVTAVRTKERDGYAAVQIGFGQIAEKKMSKGERGHLGDLPPLKHLREIRIDDVSGFAKGQKIGADRFAA